MTKFDDFSDYTTEFDAFSDYLSFCGCLVDVGVRIPLIRLSCRPGSSLYALIRMYVFFSFLRFFNNIC